MKKRIKEGKLISIFLFSILIILLTAPLISAGFFDEIWGKITGKASSLPTNVSITISGANQVSIIVWNQTLTGIDAVEGNPVVVSFNTTVIDPDGVNDINDSSVVARFNYSTTIRENSTACTQLAESNATSQNYTCSIVMWYWDQNGTWAINVTANDFGNKTYINETTKVFDYGGTTAIEISPTLLTWAAVGPGDTNQTSTQNTTINNTGNVLINPGNVKVNAINLGGMDDGSYYLNASNFTAHWEYGAVKPECLGTILVNASDTGITGANLTRGNLSEGGGVAQERLYYCIPQIPTIFSQTYATNNTGAWTIKVSS